MSVTHLDFGPACQCVCDRPCCRRVPGGQRRERLQAMKDSGLTWAAIAGEFGVSLTTLDDAYEVHKALANVDGDTIDVDAEDMALGGSIITVGASDSISDLSDATSALSAVSASIDEVSASLARLGTGSKKFSTPSRLRWSVS